MALSDPPLLRADDDGVVVATLNRPHKGNALNQPLIDALDELAADLSKPSTAEIHTLILTGAGDKAFCAGADISELDALSAETAYRQMRRGQAVFDRIEALPMVVIAAVHGYALGGGLELAMAADLRIAAPEAMLGQPEITLGNVPGWGGTQRLPRIVGKARATQLIVTGDPITADRALDWGLVNEIDPDPPAAAERLARRLADRNPVALRGAKEAIRVGLESGMAAGLVAEAEAMARCSQTEFQRQAVRQFLDRKKSRAAQ